VTDLTVSHLTFWETNSHTARFKFGMWPAGAQVPPYRHLRRDGRIPWSPGSNSEAIENEKYERTIRR